MTADLAVIIVAALPYADRWMSKYFTDLPKRREHKTARNAAKDRTGGEGK